MISRPILFSAPMVRAILDDTKTQTRRVVKLPSIIVEPGEPGLTTVGWLADHEEGPGFYGWMTEYPEEGSIPLKCPYGQPGDRLWGRETFAHIYRDNSLPERRMAEDVAYKADLPGLDEYVYGTWKPSIHMPRWASRITLEITGVRVERLQDISEADARAEGARECDPVSGREVLLAGASQRGSFKLHYRDIWEQINGPGSWDANPWVWVVEFKRVVV